MLEAELPPRCIAFQSWSVAAVRRIENGRCDEFAFDLGLVLGHGMEEYQPQAHFEFVP